MPRHALTRSRLRLALAGLSVAAVATLAPLAATPASAWTTYNTSLLVRATDTTGGQYPGGTTSSELSEDGGWLAFSRPGGGSYVKSLVSGRTTLVSVASDGTPANAASKVDGISADGQWVLFETTATNLGFGQATALDLYAHRADTGEIYRVNRTGGSPQVWTAIKPGEAALSDTADYVSYATVDNHVWDRNVTSGYLEQVDIPAGGGVGNGGSGQPSISDTGRYVTFTSSSSNLVAGDTNFVADVFERDIEADTTVRVSLSDTEVAPNLGSDHSSVSGDGTKVAFTSLATNLVTGDTNDSQDVFVRDLSTGTTLRTSLGSGTAQANSSSSHPDLSHSGGAVAFESSATNLDPGVTDTNSKPDVFVRDISGNLTAMQGRDGSQVPNQGATAPSYSSNGGAVAFTSTSTNLVTSDTNGAADAYVQRPESRGPYPGGIGDLAAGLRAQFGSDGGYFTPEVDIADGRLTTGHFIVQLAHHPAWAKDRAPVARLYQAFFHREPDLGGLNFWIKKRAAGTKLSVIAASFAGSNEFKTAYGKVGDKDFVKLVYTNVLMRQADTAGLNHWVAKLADGTSRGDIMVAFSESNEGQRKLAPEVDATLMGLAMLKKMPPNALWKDMAAASKAHAMAEWGALTILNSQAYADVVSK